MQYKAAISIPQLFFQCNLRNQAILRAAEVDAIEVNERACTREREIVFLVLHASTQVMKTYRTLLLQRLGFAGENLLYFVHDEDAREHDFELLRHNRLRRVPNRAVRGNHRLRGQVEGVIPTFITLRTEKGGKELLLKIF